jgi:hypothetical protein
MSGQNTSLSGSAIKKEIYHAFLHSRLNLLLNVRSAIYDFAELANSDKVVLKCWSA